MPELDNNGTNSETQLEATKQVAIESQVANKKKSLLVAYILFIFFFPLGLHNFYIQRTKLGWLELGCSVICIVFWILATSSFMGESDVGDILTVPIAVIFTVVLIGCWFWDLFTIPKAITRQTSKLWEQVSKKLDLDTANVVSHIEHPHKVKAPKEDDSQKEKTN